MSLLWKSWQIVTALTITVLAVFCLLATLQFHRIESDLVRERLGVLAISAQAPFQSAARIGLPLANVRNATAILQRAQTTDPQIVAIHVFAPDGRILHSTDRAAPTSVRSEVLFAVADASGPTWSSQSSDYLFTGKPLRDARGTVVGGIVVVYPTLDLLTSVQAMATKLLSYSLVILLGLTPLAFVILKLGMRGSQRHLDALVASLDGFERKSWREHAGGTLAVTPEGADPGSESAELFRLAEAAEAQYLAGGAALAPFEREDAP